MTDKQIFNKLLNYFESCAYNSGLKSMEERTVFLGKIFRAITYCSIKTPEAVLAYLKPYIRDIARSSKEEIHKTPDIIPIAEIKQTEDNDPLADYERWHKLRDIIHKLPKTYREIIMMRFWENKTYQEVADIIRSNKTSVIRKEKRALNIIKAKLLL